MKKFDDVAAAVLREWTETEYRKTVGARPRCEVTEDNEFDPKGPHRWFLEALSEASLIIALRQMAETWEDHPPYLSWRKHAAGIRQKADEWIRNAMLPSGTTLAQWYKENEPLLQQDPTNQAMVRKVAVALVPVCEAQPDSWRAATAVLSDDMTQETLTEYLWLWHARVPAEHQQFVRRVAEEFGLELKKEL
jgi:hypothetical protein